MYITRKEYEAMSFEKVLLLAINHLHKENPEVKFEHTKDSFTYGKWFKEPVTRSNYLQPEFSIRKLLVKPYTKEEKEHFQDIKYDPALKEPTRLIVL